MYETEYVFLRRVLDQFLKNKFKQIALKNGHEKDKKFGVAYLALWNVLESFAKDVAPLCHRVDLKIHLNEWICFLSGEKMEKPKNITSEKFQTNRLRYEKIPTIDLLKILAKSTE